LPIGEAALLTQGKIFKNFQEKSIRLGELLGGGVTVYFTMQTKPCRTKPLLQAPTPTLRDNQQPWQPTASIGTETSLKLDKALSEVVIATHIPG